MESFIAAAAERADAVQQRAIKRQATTSLKRLQKPSGCAGGSCSMAPEYDPLHPELFESEFKHEWLAEIRALVAKLEESKEVRL